MSLRHSIANTLNDLGADPMIGWRLSLYMQNNISGGLNEANLTNTLTRIQKSCYRHNFGVWSEKTGT